MRMLIPLILLTAPAIVGLASAAPALIKEAQAAAIAQERVLGDVIDIELDEADRGEPAGQVYEIRLLTPAGDVISVRVSAQTGTYLGAEGPDLARALRPVPARTPSP